MQKIKILTDSACDIPKEKEVELNIKIMNFAVTVDGVGYRERADFDHKEFYKMMDAAKSMPTTAQVTAFEFVEAYKELLAEGYTDIIHVTISSTGSNTYNSALMAREEFLNDVPGAASMKIHIIDSVNYTAVYGYPVMVAAQKVIKGAKADEVISYLEDWFACGEVHFAPYTLEYVKRSGRISAAAAFAGELLGLRPIINIIDGVSHVEAKVRGDKNIIPKLIEIAEKDMIPHTPYVIVKGSNDEYPEELAKAMTKKFGYPPEWFCEIGAAVACNAGHKVVGYIIKGKKRR